MSIGGDELQDRSLASAMLCTIAHFCKRVAVHVSVIGKEISRTINSDQSADDQSAILAPSTILMPEWDIARKEPVVDILQAGRFR